MKNESVNCVILGASSVEQLIENIQSLHIVPKLTYNVLSDIERILGNKPMSRTASIVGKSDK
jgi:potassium voltage-gated channel Shaker-related subfamily A beta protein 2